MGLPIAKTNETAPAIPKKEPPRIPNREDICFCRHQATDHASSGDGPAKCLQPGCKCKAFHRRPCKCGHALEFHDRRCTGDKKCQCREYSADQTAEALLRMGIRHNEWQMAIRPQILARMDPNKSDEKSRVLACIEYHTGGRRRLATKGTSNNGRPIPLRPDDIVLFLNSLYPECQIGRTNLARSLTRLEEEGSIRLRDRTRGKCLIYYYAKPRRKIVIRSDNNEPGTSPKSATSLDSFILRTQQSFVKNVLEHLQQEVPGIVINSDNKVAVAEIFAEADIVIRSAYNRAVLVIKNGNQNSGESAPQAQEKEHDAENGNARAFSVVLPVVKNKGEQQQQASLPNAGSAAAAPPPEETNLEIIRAIAEFGRLSHNSAASRMIGECRAAAPECTDAQIVAAVREIGSTLSPKVQNPVAIILTQTPKCFAGGSYQPPAARRRPVEREDRALKILRERQERRSQ